MVFKFQKPEDSPGFLLWQITNHWQRLQRAALLKLNITHAQFVILAALLYLTNQNEPVNQKIISDLTGIDKMSTSDLISTLLKKKMIKKTKSKSDARAFSLSLTVKGKNIVLKAIPVVEKIDIAFFNKKTPHLVRFSKLLNELIS